MKISSWLWPAPNLAELPGSLWVTGLLEPEALVLVLLELEPPDPVGAVKSKLGSDGVMTSESCPTSGLGLTVARCSAGKVVAAFGELSC